MTNTDLPAMLMTKYPQMKKQMARPQVKVLKAAKKNETPTAGADINAAEGPAAIEVSSHNKAARMFRSAHALKTAAKAAARRRMKIAADTNADTVAEAAGLRVAEVSRINRQEIPEVNDHDQRLFCRD